MNNLAAKQGLGQTSLLLSYASKGDVDAVKQLLDEGASANASDYDGRTALHLAASEGHVPVVELLLQQGVDVNPVDRWGDTPLADSRKYTKEVVSNILESHGGRIEVFNSQSSSHTCFIAWCNVMYVLHCSSVWLELTCVDYLGALVC
jgi:ankyrin repeat protein